MAVDAPGEDVTGWVHADYVRLLALPQAWSGHLTVRAANRLHLRACADMERCSSLSVLDIGETLVVLTVEHGWLEVRVPERGLKGWVHGDYVMVSSIIEPRASHREGLRRSTWFMAAVENSRFFGPGLLLAILAYRGFRQLPRSAFRLLSRSWGLFLGSVLLGFVIIMNQFGAWIADAVQPFADVTRLSLLWEVNSVVPDALSHQVVAPFVLALGVMLVVSVQPRNLSDNALAQGTLTGLLLAPALIVGALLLAVIGWLIVWIVKGIAWVIGMLWVPIEWLLGHIVLPILKFLATPLIWLWDHYLRSPLIWVWEVLLQPLTLAVAVALAFLKAYLLWPLAMILFGFMAIVTALFPLGVIGLTAQVTFSRGLAVKVLPQEAFAAGVALGFALLDTAVLATLSVVNETSSHPPLSQVTLLFLSFLFVARVKVAMRDAPGADVVQESYLERARAYWKTSHFEMISGCIGTPMGLVIAGVPEPAARVLFALARFSAWAGDGGD